MPAKLRSEVFDADEVGVYHCWNRLVQRRFLFGLDHLTGKDYSYRKEWVRDRLKQLAAVMAVDVLDYAILDNHIHTVFRNRPDIVAMWTDQEVARRWWFVCPLRKHPDGSAAEPLPAEIQLFATHADEYRKRLSDVSWMMRLLCQPVARRANREDGVDGRFFAKRFDCSRLETEADVLACSIYVDLNVVHAGIVDTPEESKFTSAFDRIQARWRDTKRELGADHDSSSELDDASWLSPVYLDERSDALTSLDSASDCNPVGSARISNKGFLPITIDQYLTILDIVGRALRNGKRGRIPSILPPILERLKLDAGNWFHSILDLFAQRPPLTAPH